MTRIDISLSGDGLVHGGGRVRLSKRVARVQHVSNSDTCDMLTFYLWQFWSCPFLSSHREPMRVSLVFYWMIFYLWVRNFFLGSPPLSRHVDSPPLLYLPLPTSLLATVFAGCVASDFEYLSRPDMGESCVQSSFYTNHGHLTYVQVIDCLK